MLSSLNLSASFMSSILRSHRSRSGHIKMGFDVVIDVTSEFETPCCQIHDNEVSLSDYMQLPVEQYVRHQNRIDVRSC